MIVLDTHALLWWASGSSRLSSRARRELAGGLRSGSLNASAISLFEISTAARRGRLALGMPVAEWIAQLGKIAELRLVPVSAEIAHMAGSMPDPVPGDPADRIIVATAIALKARLVTADHRLRKNAQVDTIW